MITEAPTVDKPDSGRRYNKATRLFFPSHRFGIASAGRSFLPLCPQRKCNVTCVLPCKNQFFFSSGCGLFGHVLWCQGLQCVSSLVSDATIAVLSLY